MITSDKCYVKCGCEQYAKNKDQCDYNQNVCMRLFKMNALFDLSELTMKQRERTYLRVDADGTDKDKFEMLSNISNNIGEFVANGSNLYIHSSICGNGKTAWAIRMMQSYIGKIWFRSDIECRALFIHVPKFLIAIKDNISNRSDYVERVKNNVKTADIVVFDEIGTKAPSQFEHENLLSIINDRIDSGKTNIYTSNLNSNELREVLGERLYSRVVNLSTNIELNGQDKRGLIK